MIYFPTKPRSGHHIIANVDLWMDTIFYMVFLDNIIANIIFIKSSFFWGTVKFLHEQYLLNGSFSEKFCWNCLLDLCNCTIVHYIFSACFLCPYSSLTASSSAGRHLSRFYMDRTHKIQISIKND